MNHHKQAEIFGVGNPIYDICVNIHGGYLRKLRSFIPAAQWEQSYHVGDTLFEQILESLPTVPQKVVPGGGAFNTIRVLAQLGHPTAYTGGLGTISNQRQVHASLQQGSNSDTDVHSRSVDGFSREMQLHGIRDCTMRFAGRPSGRSLSLTQEHREILIFNPAAATLLHKAEQCTVSTEKAGPQLIYIEGFILPREDLVRTLVTYGKMHSTYLAVDLGAAPIVAAKKEFLLKEVLPYTTYLFGTEEEYAAIGLAPVELLAYLRPGGAETGFGQHACLIVKRGASGSRLLYGTHTFDISAEPTRAVNSLGAGDAYAAFFISELLRGTTPETAARLASYGCSLFLNSFGGFLDTRTVAAIRKQFFHSLRLG